MSDASSEQRFAAQLRTVGKWAYWIIGLIVIGYGAYFFYNTLMRPITGVLFFMAGILFLYFYYVKWFVIPGKKPDWPPYQTPCPDYLTLMPGNTSGGADASYKCIDFVGVSRNGRLKRADPRQIDTQVNMPDYYFLVNPKEERGALQQRLMAYGLTWNSLFGDN